MAKIYDTATMTLQASAIAVDEFLKRPGIYGIYGNPAISTVTIDELIALPNFEAHLDV